MGGGKSHGLIGLWHLVAHPKDFGATELGHQVFGRAREIASDSLPSDLHRPIAVVLSCDNMTPGKGDQDLDGPAETLGERFLWRLFDGAPKLYREYRQHTGNKAKLAEAINAVGRPVLILVDEILDYIRQATVSNVQGLLERDMAFIRALLDTVNDVPNCSMVVVMIASDKDHIVMNDLGDRCRDEIHDLLVRNGRTATVTTANDFAEIIRRRLFDHAPPAEVVHATAKTFVDPAKGGWRSEVFNRLAWASEAEFDQKVARSYPFHPALIDLAEHEWSLSTGFQRVRSTIQIFAAGVFAQQLRAEADGWTPLLIGPGDLPLSNRDVREALLNSGLIDDQRTVASYREIAATEVVHDDDYRGTARQLDLKREGALFEQANPRAAERMATVLFVYSIGQRPQGRRGATEPELKAASFVPDASYATGDAEIILAELRSPDTGLAALEELPGRGGQSPRLILSTRQTLNMFFRAQRNAISDDERDAELAETVWKLAKTGLFKAKVLVEAPADAQDPRPLREILAAAGIDDARTTRLVILDPRRFSFLNGVDEETRSAVRAALGIGPDKLPVGWASSAVFAVVNTQRRALARNHAAAYLAWTRVADIETVRADKELTEKARRDIEEARRRLEKAVRDSYQHVVYLGEDEGNRVDASIRFDKEGQSSLDGSIVWAALSAAEKAFGVGEFDAKALLHNLRAEDWGRPLSEVRDAFWNTPRLPLLPGGDDDLRRAIWEALQAGELRLVDKDGAERIALGSADINVGSAGLRLVKPTPVEAEIAVPDVVGKERLAARIALESVGLRLEGVGNEVVASQTPPPGTLVAPGTVVSVTFRPREGPAPKQEFQVSVTLNTSLTDNQRREAARLLLSTLSAVTDEDASHIQLSVKITTSETSKEEILDRGQAAGGHTAEIEL